jgi:hypothetical protein
MSGAVAVKSATALLLWSNELNACTLV